MSRALDRLVAGTPAAWLRVIECDALIKAFARAFGVEAPSLRGFTPDEALDAFRSFTAACMEEALVDGAVAARYREGIGDEALALGARVRRLLLVREDDAFLVTRFFYRGIGIEIAGELPGPLSFEPCAFSRRYSPACCWFMSAFDEGFMRGITGLVDARLIFSQRLTEGAPCCEASFEVPA